MGTLTVNATNGQTVAAGASYTVSYPAGKSAADYLATGAKITTSDGSIYSATVSLGASSITITNPTGRAIASGGFDYLDLQSNGTVAIIPDGETNVTARTNPLTGGISLSVGQQLTNTMVCLGDSIIYRVGNVSGNNILTESTSYLGWANGYMGGAFSFYNYGVSSDTTELVLARMSPALAAAPGGWLHLLVGGNDAAGDVAASVSIANLAEIISQCVGAGYKIVIGTIYPFTAVNTAARRSALSQINNYLRSLQNVHQQILVADYYSAMVDTAGAIRTSYLIDGTHPSPLGASIMGRVLQNTIGAFVGQRTSLLSSSYYDSDMGFGNGNMVGNHAAGASGFTVGTGVTGNGPRGWGWTRSGSGITATVSKQARTSLVNPSDFARGVITVTGADNDYLRLQRDIVYRLWSSSGVANYARRFYVPATGAQYDVLVDGNLAAGDNTATWPTTPGSVFTDGSATLICITPLTVGSYFQGACECVISGVSVGAVQPTMSITVLDSTSAIAAAAYSLNFNGVGSSGVMAGSAETTAGLTLVTPKVVVPAAALDLQNTTASAGPLIRARLDLAVSSSALATVDWGRVTVRVTT